MKVSYYDFGSANIVIAMLIATMKASLVAAFFMHLRHDKLFNTLAFLAAFLFLGIFILLTYDDIGKARPARQLYGGRVSSRRRARRRPAASRPPRRPTTRWGSARATVTSPATRAARAKKE